jgi:DNA repair protein RadC
MPKKPKPKYTQAYNPQTKRWMKIETRTGRIVGRKRTTGAYKDLPKRKTALKAPKAAAKPAKRKAKTPSTGKKHVYAKPKKLMSMVGGVKQSTIEGGTTKTPRKKKTTGKRGIPDKIPNRIKDMGWVNIKTQQVQVECKKLTGLKSIKMPEDVADLVGDMSTNDREEVRVVYMDHGNKVIGIESAHKGSVNASHCEPHEIFKTALLLNANQLILVHNHPSGNPTPSDADIVSAERFRHNGKMLGVTVRDSIIIGRDKFYSLKQEGHFK